MKITILCIGKLKERYLLEACQEYLKRLGKYATIQVQELNESRLTSDNPSGIELVKNQESAALIAKLNKQDYKILLSLRGQEIDSPAFANIFRTKMNEGHSSFCFIIGGSYGTNQELEKQVDYSLCLSPMTFPHQLTRVILLEQIYRSFKILNNETYHK